MHLVLKKIEPELAGSSPVPPVLEPGTADSETGVESSYNHLLYFINRKKLKIII